ncbi:LppM family (lipo)protein [Mariniluteicoccus endophyticus]
MRTPLRRSAILLVMVLLAVGLAGCGRVNGRITVHPDDTADLRIDISAVDDSGKVRDQFKKDCQPTVAPKPVYYAKDGRVGCRIEGRANAAKMANFGVQVYTVDGRQRFTFAKPDLDANDPEDAPMKNAIDQMVAVGELDMRVSFRGKVLSHSGSSTVEGRTVVWRHSGDLAEGLTAEAQEPGLLDRTVGEWIAIAAALLLAVGAVAWVVRDVRARSPLEHRQPWGGPRFTRRR